MMHGKALPIPNDTKFSNADLVAKQTLRAYRLHRGLGVRECADLLGVSQKQMEDLEAVRNYGVRIPWEILARAQMKLGIPLADFIEGPRV